MLREELKNLDNKYKSKKKASPKMFEEIMSANWSKIPNLAESVLS